MSTRILLVDDEPNILTPIEFLMKKEGYVIEKAYDGVQALSKMKSFQPNLVILDVMMPLMDGFEVARKIRKEPAYEDVRIIFLTARGTDADKINGFSKGAESYIVKPFDNDTLVNMVREMVEFG